MLGESSRLQQLVDAMDGQVTRHAGVKTFSDWYPDCVGCHNLEKSNRCQQTTYHHLRPSQFEM